MPTAIRAYIRSLGVDAYVVGGAVRDQLLGVEHRDEDFLVPGVDQAGLRALLEPHGRVEDMEVHGQLVGVRLHPRDREIRALAPSGIDLVPPRAERSTGPGHHDFEIVSGPSIGLEEDMARRDFTINAMAIRLAGGELVDPFGGKADLEQGIIRTVSPESLREDPLRIVRALRFVSQLGFELAPDAVLQMEAGASGLDHVSAERIGGGIKADAQGELSKLLLGGEPARALRLARDTGVLTTIIPEFGPTIGFSLGAERQPVPLDEHLFAVAQRAADNGDRLEVRLAALLHDLGKPLDEGDGDDHAYRGAALADEILARLRYPTRVRHHVVWIVAHHGFALDHPPDARDARRFLAEHGDELARDLIDHKAADLGTKDVPIAELMLVEQLRELVAQQRSQPHHLSDLAITGDDLRSIGFAEGPGLGKVLKELLADVVDDPTRNDREWLLARAARELKMNADAVREAYASVCDEAGPNVTVVAATKYVAAEEMDVLARAGILVVGENRAQDLQRKHELDAESFRWHFIGALQSNKARVVSELCELVHAVDTDSAARRLTVPWLLEVNLAGEASKSGVEESEIEGYRDRYPLLSGLMTMPPFADDPEASRPTFRRLAQLAREHGLAQLSMGTSQDWRVGVDEGATLIRVGSALFR